MIQYVVFVVALCMSTLCYAAKVAVGTEAFFECEKIVNHPLNPVQYYHYKTGYRVISVNAGIAKIYTTNTLWGNSTWDYPISSINNDVLSASSANECARRSGTFHKNLVVPAIMTDACRIKEKTSRQVYYYYFADVPLATIGWEVFSNTNYDKCELVDFKE